MNLENGVSADEVAHSPKQYWSDFCVILIMGISSYNFSNKRYSTYSWKQFFDLQVESNIFQNVWNIFCNLY